MKTKKLCELGSFKNGLNFSKEAARGTGCKILGVGDFGRNTFIPCNSLEEITASIVEEDDLIKDNDILFVRSNGNKALVGRILFAKDIRENICFSGFCIRFRPNVSLINPNYLFYMLKSEFCKRQYTPSQQTNITNLSQDTLGAVQIPIFNNLKKKKSLVDILYFLDSKIDTNEICCFELESMAKMIYDYWFTQFDFPNADGKPYRISGGKMVWNEQLKREIPEGWEVGTVDSILAIDNSSVDPSKLGDTIMEHYSIPAFDDGKYPVYEPANTIESGKYAVNRECILTSKLNPHFKRLWDPYCDTDNAICSTEFIVYRPRDLWTRSYCYAVLNSDSFYAHMVSNATASTGSRKRIQPDISASFQLAIPDEQTMRAFIKVYDPILKQLKNLRKENHELANLRDWLLPMLMNGQATVE